MGYIVVIEGTDGSGKQTQSKMLCERLKESGRIVRIESFPNYDSLSSGPVKMYLSGKLGENANDVNPKQASTLYATDRLCTYLESLKEHYENGGIIIFDRYVQSNMLHQACKIKNKAERNEFLEWLDNFEFNELGLPRADKVIFLDMPPKYSIELAHARADLKAGTTKDIHEQDEKHLEEAYKSGQYVAKKYKWEVVSCVDEYGIRSKEDIADEIFDIVSIDLYYNYQNK